MMREHVVETLEWQVGFASEEEAFEAQGRLASLLRGPALDAISEVFDEVGAGRELLALDTLEIDLGTLPRADLDVQLQQRLRDRLREALWQAMGEVRGSDAHAPFAPSGAGQRVDLLKRYLAEGFLPWQAGHGTRRRLVQLAQQLAQGDGAGMTEWLRTAPAGASVRWAALLRGHVALLRPVLDAALSADSPLDTSALRALMQLLAWDTAWAVERLRQIGQTTRVRRRMARQLGEPLLLAVVGALVPGDSDFIRAVIDEAAAFGRAQDPPVPPAQMRPRLWEFTLAYLLVERGSDFNRRSYLGSLLRQNARQDGLEYPALLQSLIASLQLASGSAALRKPMLALLQQLAGELGEDAHASEAQASTLPAASIASEDGTGLSRLGRAKLHLQAVLEGAMPWGAAAARAWDLLRSWDVQWLLDEVRKECASAPGRERVVRALGEARLRQCAALLAPADTELIEAGALSVLQALQRARSEPLAHALPALPRGARPGSRRWRQLALPQRRFAWRAALAAGDPACEAGRAVWDELVRFDREWLAEATAHYLAAEAGRHVFAAQLGTGELMAVVELLSPGAGPFIEAVAGRAPALAGPTLRPAAAQQRVWEFTLAWLAAERGSEFNRRSYLGALVRRSAQRDGVSEHSLLLALLHSLEAVPVSNASQRGLLALVRELLGAAGQGPTAAHEGAALALTLCETAAPTLPQARAWRTRVSALLARPDAATQAAALTWALDTPAAVSRLVMLLPPATLRQLLARLRPAQCAPLLRCADEVMAEAVAAGVRAPAARWVELRWRFVYEFLFAQGRAFEPVDFRQRMAAWLAAQLREPAWTSQADRRASPEHARRGASQRSPSPQPQAQRASKPARPPAASPAPASEASREPIYVANAGIVLAEPFLPRLFSLCGLVQGDAFAHPAAASRAVHLLQALVGGAGPWLEHELVLNKLLCGLAIAEPLQWDGELDEKERATVDGLLGAMLQQWKVLGGTSIDGLRQTFLRREGRLVDEGEFWHLLVEPGPYDMLVDQLPWGFSTIKYPWMERMIHVQWR